MYKNQNFLLSFGTRSSVCLRVDLNAPVRVKGDKVVRDMLVALLLFSYYTY